MTLLNGKKGSFLLSCGQHLNRAVSSHRGARLFSLCLAVGSKVTSGCTLILSPPPDTSFFQCLEMGCTDGCWEHTHSPRMGQDYSHEPRQHRETMSQHKTKQKKILNKRKKKGAKTERVTGPGHTHRAEDKP